MPLLVNDIAGREISRASLRKLQSHRAVNARGPLARRQRQRPPSETTAEQHVSVGGIGLKGATAALHGIDCTSAEKNVLLHPPTSSTGNVGGGGGCSYGHEQRHCFHHHYHCVNCDSDDMMQ